MFENHESFRAACDDYIAEAAGTRGEWNLLADAIRLGEYRRLMNQIELGADPVQAIDAHGSRLASERGTQETTGARWALATLAFATGAVPEDVVLARHGGRPSAGPPPAALTTPRENPGGPVAPGLPTGGSSPTHPRSPRVKVRWLVTGAVVVVVALAAAVGTLLTREDGSPSDKAAPETLSTGADTTSTPGDTETETDEEVRAFAATACTAMFTRDFRNYDQQVAEALGLMTESFAAEFRGTTDAIRSAFVGSSSSIDVEDVETVLVKADEKSARVLVSFTQRFRSDGATTATPSKALLVLVKDGGDTWRVADLKARGT